MVHVFGSAQCLELREPDQHFRRSLGFGCQHELNLDAIDDHRCFDRLLDDVIRRDQGRCTAGIPFSKPGIHLSSRPFWQERSVLVKRAAAHGVSGEDVLTYGVVEKAVGRDDLDTVIDVLLGNDTSDSAVMVGVRMGVDHRLHRPFIPTGDRVYGIAQAQPWLFLPSSSGR